MHDVSLPLTGLLSDASVVSLARFDLGHLTQIAGWSDFPQAVGPALARLGLALPDSYRRSAVAGDTCLWRIAPDRVLIRSPRAVSLADQADLAVLDLSDARIGLRIAGAGAAALLARLAAVDVAALAPGGFVQAPVHRIGLLIERVSADTFDLLIPTTWARSLTGLIGAHLQASPAAG